VSERPITAAEAQALFDKLSPHLELAKGEGNPVAEPWGCYPPKRNGRNDLRDWPLSAWRGPGTSPLCVRWVAQSQRRPTFAQFVRIYRLDPVERP
jgi:hypothetical protein